MFLHAYWNESINLIVLDFSDLGGLKLTRLRYFYDQEKSKATLKILTYILQTRTYIISLNTAYLKGQPTVVLRDKNNS